MGDANVNYIARTIRPSCKVAVIGAGLAGLATAVSLQRVGHQVTVFEISSGLKEIGAGINVATNATILFKEWGILSQLEEVSIEPEIARMFSHKSQLLSSTIISPDFKDLYKTPYLITHRAELQNLLFNKATKLGAVTVFSAMVKKINFEESALEFADGTTQNFDVIFGADGEKSFCREALLGREDPLDDSGFDIYRATVKIDDVAELPDLAELVEVHSINMWIGPEGHTVTYPIRKGNLLNIVLTHQHESDSPLSMGPESIGTDNVHQAFKDWSPQFHKLLDVPTAWMKRTMMYSRECNSWLHPLGYFAILGDSAHGSPPYLAQGAAMAFEDAAVLGVLFSKFKNKDDIPELLKIYDRLRRPRALMCRNRSKALRDVYALENGPEQEERDRMLLHDPSYDGSPNFLEDPVLRNWLYGYNAVEATEEAWFEHMKQKKENRSD
ncbi:hypothetical protein BCIN_05g03510 [Botrytis cinerea B05.10]|uniref:FAD-binding domain-containing protein n=1 Tax=Botryotinia fuckeliana (strain B05.10) TaxID=332648 RepID=A0A384JHR0_BOTFB|nr:hypothetical protein BCIN_05g03510 [Botrytis cinerea B05.10]ATZ49957.1 hypothetical protein BCIN_05g03510 [Botrytis cinerea B05.10]